MANCNLITTTNGTVTHIIDGALHAAMYPDCILNGCTITASGSTVTMSAGTFIVGGRVIENSASSSWTLPITGASASLVCRINDETLEFITYATNAPTLTQEDINDSGSVYDAIIATCTVDGSLSIATTLPKIAKNGGILYGTSENPPSGSYANGTLYIQYEA